MSAEKIKNRLPGIFFTAVFIIAVMCLGFLSFISLSNHYISGEAVNNEMTADAGNQFETDISSTFFQKLSFVNINGAIRKLLGQREMNGVVKLDNGYLTVPMEECPKEYLDRFAHSTAAFNRYLQDRGTALLYAATPYTTGKYDPMLPVGTEDHVNQNIDRLLELLTEAGVETLDIRDRMRADGIDHYDMMYRTDHHWTTEAGFYAYRLLESWIAEKTGCELDPRISDIDNYTLTTYKEWHLGSRGQRTGIYYAGIDDFTLILPNFETAIRNQYGEVKTMQRLFIDMDPLSTRDFTSRYTYDTVLGGGAYLGHYVNENALNGVKVMIITDSFAKAVNPYLIMQFAEIDSLYDGYAGSITPETIEAFDPDVVIMLYYSEYINAESVAFDFRGFIN